MAKRYKRHRDYGFFDQDIRLSKLSQLGDPLEKLKEGIDFEICCKADYTAPPKAKAVPTI